jgi:hypothetical protein
MIFKKYGHFKTRLDEYSITRIIVYPGCPIRFIKYPNGYMWTSMGKESDLKSMSKKYIDPYIRG